MPAAPAARSSCSSCRLVALNTSMLLLSSITYGFAMLAMDEDRQAARDAGLAGGDRPVRLGLPRASRLYEFTGLIRDRRDGPWSQRLPVVLLHAGRARTGCTSPSGMVWLVTLMVQVQWKFRPDRPANKPPADVPVSLFWHFLDVIWIGVFTFVYLLGILR